MKIEYHPKIEVELKEIINYYNKIYSGLGHNFLNDFESQVIKIVTNPERWEIVIKKLRRCMLAKFPYVIYYRIIRNETIRITVVKHQKRHPNLGLSRL